MGIDLRNMTASQALAFAKLSSGLTVDQIAERSGIGACHIKRYLNPNESDQYFPSLPRVPILCEALGNTILAEWVAAQIEPITEGVKITNKGHSLLVHLNRLGGEFGQVCQAADAALADDTITGEEAGHIIGEIRDMEKKAKAIRHGLQPLAET